MRKLFTLRTLLPVILFVSMLPNIGFGQTTIAKWTFEGVITTNTGTTPIISGGSAVADAGSQTAGSAFTGFHTALATTWSNPAGNGSAKSLSSNTWSVNDYYQFLVNTTGYTSISISFDHTGSGTGPRDFKVQYSIDGTAFLDFTGNTYTIPRNPTTGAVFAWSTTTAQPLSTLNFDLSSITAINNTSGVYFRIVDISTASLVNATVATGGTSRVDNFTVKAGETVTTTTPTVSVAGGNHAAEPSTPGTFNITLSSAAPAGGVTVTYSLGGTATKTGIDADYTDPQNGSITIPAGSTSGIVTLNTIGNDDAVYEGIETITITLNSATTTGPVFDINSLASGAAINLLDNDPAPPIVINEVYGGGGNGGATWKNDFIELYNPTNVAVNLNGWSVQYASAAGSSWSVTNLTGSIPAHGYYLIQEAAGTATGTFTNLPTPDAIGSIGMSATAAKVALVTSTTPLTGTCPTGSQIIDFVGFGSSSTTIPNCFEGSSYAPATSNTTSIQRNPIGFDSDNNNTDFVLLNPPTPKNSVTDVTPPTVISVFPADNATGVMTSFTATITFNENIQKGTGTITLKKADGTTVRTIDVATLDVTVSGTSASFNINSLLFNTGYYFEISAGAFKDGSDNNFAGLTGSSAWNFTTSVTPPAGTLGTTYNFNTCSGNLPNGFTQYSVTGPQIWGCTSFGRDAANPPSGSAPNGLQINGFANDANVANLDWLISPSFDLTATTYPLLSFWSRTAFTGATLQLKVSTNYSGTGDPNLATWTDLNGKFPAQVSDVWKLSENINLTDYKSANTYFAFVYTSTTEDGARWTLDDITVTNSLTPPPPSLTTSATDIQYTFVANGATSDKTFTFIGNDLTGGVTLTSTGAFTLSKEGTTFSSSITYTFAEANNIPQTVYVRFAPNQNNQTFTGTATISTPGLTNTVINLNGSSIDPATTLEVVNWNIEWFSSPTLGPTNDAQQEQNVKTIMQSIGADIYALSEVVDEAALAAVVAQMPGYSYVISNYGSHTNTCANPPGALADAQKLAFVYKTALFTNVTTTALLSSGINTCADAASTSYNNWASGRYPFMMSADVTLNCVTKNVKFILVHAKANTAPTATSYARRKAGADELHALLETPAFASENIILLGDYNDDLDQSITTGFTTTSWSAFTTDASDFPALTLPLSLAGKKSTVSYNDVIDHVIISNDLQPYYLPGSARILTDVSSLVTKYGTTTTDHYPVFTRYIFPNTTMPTVTTCPTVPVFCGAGTYTIPSFIATDDCNDAITYSYVISGATSRSGTTNDASGNFNAGTNTITWTAADTWGNSATCTTTVTVQQSYPYYVDADNDGYGFGPVVMLCSASAPLGYSVNNYDCDDNDKGKKRIIVCHNGSPLCIDENALQGHLKHGDQLGSCTSITTSARTSSNNLSVSPVKTDISASGDLDLSNYPNPFSASTVISYYVPVDSKVSLIIYNGLGQAVTTLFEGEKKAGAYTINFNGSKLTNGFYYCKLTALSNKQQFVKSIKLSVGK